MSAIEVRPMRDGDLTSLLLRELPGADEGALAAGIPADELVALLAERRARGVAFHIDGIPVACLGIEPVDGDPETGSIWFVVSPSAAGRHPVAIGMVAIKVATEMAEPFDHVRGEVLVGDARSTRLLEAWGAVPLGEPESGVGRPGLWQAYLYTPQARRAAA